MTHEAVRVTRRSVLETMSWATVVAGIGAISSHWAIRGLRRYRLEDVAAETFRPYVGHHLIFERPAEGSTSATRKVELKLTKVTSHENISQIESRDSAKCGKRQRESFSLLFEQKGSEALGPGLHRLANHKFEDFQIFLSPVGVRAPDGTNYLEAIFG